jgi:hypothetical protein
MFDVRKNPNGSGRIRVMALNMSDCGAGNVRCCSRCGGPRMLPLHASNHYRLCSNPSKGPAQGYASGQNTINAGTAVNTMISDNGKPRRG